ncbi:MAG: putative Fe-S cluster assembly protein SufT [Deltaproteobacteria bacterium]|nr:putative Fe-S cluster assembly protein SufT [Deltaproteobacteria bacterium]
MDEQVMLSRDCEAVQIPAGHTVTLPQGTVAIITQSLGGTYTLQVPSFGGLYRIGGTDGDAIGKAPTAAPAPQVSAASGEVLEANVWDQLKTCYDPEIPVNIVDLGLVYDMQLSKLPSGNSKVEVKMTLTAPGCGMGTAIAHDARMKLLDLPGIEQADVDLVWDPPWSPQMISPEGRALLGMD